MLTSAQVQHNAIAQKTGLPIDTAANYIAQHLPGAAKSHFGG